MIEVYRIKGKNIYPIYKNGRSSVMFYARARQIRPLINGQIKRVDTVTVYLRDPRERFISGVHSFIEFEKRKAKIDYDTVLHMIASHGLMNEHFEPQHSWLRRLSEYFSGDIELQPVSALMELIENRDRPGIPDISETQRNKIDQIQPNHTADDFLLDSVGQTIPIQTMIERIDNVLS